MLEHVQLRLVETLAEAEEFLSWVGQRRPILAFDTETTGLQWWTPNFVRLVQFGDGETGWALSARDWRGVIRTALQAVQDSRQPVAAWNAPFDMHALDADGLPLPAWRNVHDGKVMDHLLDPLRPHGLKSAADRVWPGASAGQGMLRHAFSRNGWNWATVPDDLPAYWQYAALDTVLTARLAERDWPQVHARGLFPAYEREMAVQATLFRAEKRGMRIDVGYTVRLREVWAAELKTLGAELEALGIPNPNSNRQIEAALKAVGWEPEEYTPTGEAKLDKVILAELARHLGADVAPRVLRFKRLVKWTSAYLDTFLSDKDQYDRVHASINTMAAKTGRMSITNPPLQTLPRGAEIRKCIVPGAGNHLLAVDYDGQEGRVFASYAKDDALIRAFRDGLDVHRYAAAQAYGVPLADVTAEQRQVAKAVTFAKLYGAGAQRIADTAGISKGEADQFIAAYEAAFPGIPLFMRQVEAMGRKRLADTGRAYVNTWGGREMVAPEDGLYKLVNGLVQGSCADVLKQVLVDLDAAGAGDFVVLPVHDELIFEIPAGDFDEARTLIIETMTQPDAFAVPLTVHASEALANWGGDPA